MAGSGGGGGGDSGGTRALGPGARVRVNRLVECESDFPRKVFHGRKVPGLNNIQA